MKRAHEPGPTGRGTRTAAALLFGFRLRASGSLEKLVVEDEDSIVAGRAQRGRLDLATSLFWRSPERGSLGLAYAAEFGFVADSNAVSNRQQIAIGGALFLGDFDLGAGLGYAFGSPTYLVYDTFLGPDAQVVAFRLDGAVADLGATWYVSDAFSAQVVAGFSYSSEAPPEGLSSDSALKFTQCEVDLVAG